MKNLVLLLSALIIGFSACKKEDIKNQQEADAWDTVPMNKVQVLASHNSYRKRTYEPIYNFVQSIKSALPASLNPDDWDYTHIPLHEQFSDYGVRSIEIDIYYDPNGGRFYNRGGMSLVSEPVESGIAELNLPGYKVLHIPDVDFETHYITFKQALTAVKNWSDAHPRHLPISIYVETKQETAGDRLPINGFVKGIPYTAESADELDAEIKAVFGANLDKVITPDKLRGDFNTLNEAALAGNWPKLKDARGKICFVMNGGMMSVYRQGKSSLEGRAMFLFANPGQTDAAFVIRNSPKGNEAAIADLVRQGYMVRTRADSNTEVAKTGDYSGATAALASGAQIVTTDYYKPDLRCDTGTVYTCYKVAIPDGKLARISPAFADYSVNGELKE